MLKRLKKPIPPKPGRPIPKMRKRKVRTKAIDPAKGPTKGKLNKGAAEPMDTKTRVPVALSKMKKRNPKKPSSGLGGGQPPQPKGPPKIPGAKDGGMMKKTKGYKSGGMMKSKGYRTGGAVNKRKATGAATKGFGKAYMKGKR